MTSTDTETMIRQALHEVAPDADLDRLAPDADFRETPAWGLDSLDFLRLVELLSTRTGQRMTPVVVAGVDGTSNALFAVDRAAEEAKLRGSPLRLVHALGLHRSAIPSAGFVTLQEAATRARHRHTGLNLSTVLCLGSPAEVLLQYLGDSGLLVLGIMATANWRVYVLRSPCTCCPGFMSRC